MQPSRQPLRLLALPLAGWLLAATPAVAQTEAAPTRSWLSDATAVAGSAFGAALDGAGAALRTAGSFVLPEAPFDFVPERLRESDLAFIAMMQTAGLSLAEIEAGGGLLPDVRYRFVAAREPSAADYARAARALVLHESRYSGLRAFAQRRIMQTVLEAGEGGRYQVAMLEIAVRPWPSIRYVLAARERPLDDADRRLLEALRESLQR
jgi:hypothetical protein